MPIPGENNNTSENFEPYENKESLLENQDIEGDHRDFVGKSLDTRK